MGEKFRNDLFKDNRYHTMKYSKNNINTNL